MAKCSNSILLNIYVIKGDSAFHLQNLQSFKMIAVYIFSVMCAGISADLVILIMVKYGST